MTSYVVQSIMEETDLNQLSWADAWSCAPYETGKPVIGNRYSTGIGHADMPSEEAF